MQCIREAAKVMERVEKRPWNGVVSRNKGPRLGIIPKCVLLDAA
jgi:hypothetical protein